MAEHNYHQAGLQHLAHLQQDSVPHLGASVLQHRLQTHLGHNPWAAEAGLEAYLQRQQQEALVAVQALEQQRLQP